MGRTVKHTDLSWEVPGLRADVDVPLEDPVFPGSDLAPWAGADWPDDPDREPQHESPRQAAAQATFSGSSPDPAAWRT
jgi:hypothetical protein